MQTEETIKEELSRHIARRKLIFNDPTKESERKIHDDIISTLEWVLKGSAKND